ncbi:hypothetical protein BM536_001535 [Streptomyces phaeoluteigriseus]|uniref:Uncharacterized protein n=1 Tax=Streptomyces phaeoluteigriseus TaxID=114686 RepID=A0A1V6MZH9_9ACTN|nr:hypothetical protein BM536_001535 [Streptomyces phaeoluteigriseus]
MFVRRATGVTGRLRGWRGRSRRAGPGPATARSPEAGSAARCASVDGVAGPGADATGCATRAVSAGGIGDAAGVGRDGSSFRSDCWSDVFTVR